jgi:Ca2+-binding RTX toxin-like protein
MARRNSAPKSRAGMLAGAAAVALLALPAAASAAVTSGVAGGTLTVTSDAGDAITITCVANAVQVNGGNPGSGPAACDAITSIVVTGGPDANVIDLSGVSDRDDAVDTDYPAITSVTIDGAAGNDTITGSEHADILRGGDGNDRIVGDENKAAGSLDVFEGQAGDDTLVWNPGHDSDKLDGGDGADTIEVNGGGGGEQFTVKPSTTAGRVQFDRTGPTPPGPFSLDIGTAEKLDMNANGGDDSFTADAGLEALGFKLDVDGGAGNDTLDGGDGADLIEGGEGNDRITPDDNPPLPGPRDDARGGAGDDTIVWNGGDDDDLNEGGDGIDTIEVNGATLPEQFTVKPSPTAGRILFDRLTTPPGPFNIDIGTAERLDLNMNAGDDTLTADPGFDPNFKLDVEGGDGNDSLDGGDAADLLAGGEGDDRIVGDDNPLGTRDDVRGDGGNDTMVWNPGDDDDINEGGAGNDTAEVNGAGGAERFSVKPSAVAGRVSFDRNDPTPFNVDIGTTEALRLNAGGGDDRIAGSKGLAGLISSTFNGDDGNDRITGTDGEDALAGGKGHDLIKARDKAEDTVDCGSGLDLAIVDKRDFLRGCDIVAGGLLRVKPVGKLIHVAGGGAVVKLRCVATKGCKGKVRLRRAGKTLAAGSFRMDRGKADKVRLKLNRRGRRVLAGASAKRIGAKLQIDARDANGNGWRTTARVKLAS